MKGFIKYAGIVVSVLLVVAAGCYIWFIETYPKVGPAPDIKVDMSPATIAQGRYLFRHVAVCYDCHSTWDTMKFGSPDIPGTIGKGGETFTGPGYTVYARNLTPYNLRDWTDGEIYRAITTGVDRYGKPLFPVMPYQHFRTMDPGDIKAIISYMRTLKPIAYDPPPRHLSLQWRLKVRTFPKPASPRPRPPLSDTVAYGKYLITMANCQYCHTENMAGGEVYKLPGGILRSANITPDSTTGIGAWTWQQFLHRFRSFDVPYDSIPAVGKYDFSTVMPVYRYAKMKTGDLRAIYKYLRTIRPVNSPVVRFIPVDTTRQ